MTPANAWSSLTPCARVRQLEYRRGSGRKEVQRDPENKHQGKLGSHSSLIASCGRRGTWNIGRMRDVEKNVSSGGGSHEPEAESDLTVYNNRISSSMGSSDGPKAFAKIYYAPTFSAVYLEISMYLVYKCVFETQYGRMRTGSFSLILRSHPSTSQLPSTLTTSFALT